MTKSRLQKILLLLLLVVVSIVVGFMFKNFFMVLALAGITAALVNGPYKKLVKKSQGKRSQSALVMVVLVVLGALIPLGLVVGMFSAQAIDVSKRVAPFVQEQLATTHSVDEVLLKLPMGSVIVAYQDQIIEKIGGLVQGLSSFLVGKISAITLSAFNFVFLLFLYLYSLFFLIRDGGAFMRVVLYYLPFENDFEEQLIARFLSVTRATLKGTLLIGLIQGSIAGLALWVFGISSPLFWTVIMVILSVIPLIGTPLVWVPAGIFLMVTGHVGAGVGLIVFCGLVVSNIDNILRPVFIGQDTKLHELLVLFSTLGGLAFFGVSGFIIGPIIVGLWVTLWEVYSETFAYLLPVVVSSEKARESLEEKEVVPMVTETTDTTEA